jgi:hypothetical protein
LLCYFVPLFVDDQEKTLLFSCHRFLSTEAKSPTGEGKKKSPKEKQKLQICLLSTDISLVFLLSAGDGT